MICVNMPFEAGNQEAKKASKVRSFAAALKLAINETEGDQKKLRLVADALIAKAIEGDVSAIKEIADRMDGKAVASKEISGPDGGEIPVSIRVSWD